MLKLFTDHAKEYGPLRALPVTIRFWSPKAQKCEVRNEEGGVAFVQTYTPADPLDTEDVDAEALLKAFLKVKIPAQAKKFLGACGPFFPVTNADPFQQTITWEEFQGWQHFVKERHLGGFPEEPRPPAHSRQEDTLCGLYPRVSPPLALEGPVWPRLNDDPGPNNKRLAVSCTCALTVMTTFILTEQDAGKKYLDCQNKNCSRPGRLYIEGRKGSSFCSEKCRDAHGERDRKKRRREEKLAALAASAQPATA